jgi:hypothetical protein
MPSDDAFRRGQDIRDRAFRFACRIVKFCERLYQIGACNVGPVDEATKLRVEANELVSIVTTIVGNTKANCRPEADSPQSGDKLLQDHSQFHEFHS